MQSVDVTDESKMFTLKLTYKHTLPDVVKKMRIYFFLCIEERKTCGFFNAWNENYTKRINARRILMKWVYPHLFLCTKSHLITQPCSLMRFR